MDSAEAKKKRAALAALDYIPPGASLGVGTGSTVEHLIDALPSIADQLGPIVSSSVATTEKLQALGLDVTDLNSVGDIDVYIDGADEATKHLQLIKGGGGALTREKILAAAARRFICIIDDSKLVGMLGSFPLPIEVIPMAQSYVARQIIRSRGQPIWREDYVTDNSNHIIDVHNLQIANPVEMESRIGQLAGVVTVGLFAQRPADVLLVGDDSDSVRKIER
ncbi:MAG: ribose-5-phosphate isomerase RpiA [Pseudomonadota bacterium]